MSALMFCSISAQAYDVVGYDVTKRSVSEAADESGLSFEEYKNYMYFDDATEPWEVEHIAELKTKASVIINLMEMSVDEFKETYGLTIDITEDTTMCEIYDNMTLETYWGDFYDDEVAYYGIADKVTPQTLYGEVRLEVEKQLMDEVERVTFSDVGYKHWAHYYITQMQKVEVIDGYNDGTYKPEKTVTRAEFAKIFAIATAQQVGDYENKYEDVSEDAWYAPYVNAVSDYIDAENGMFNPEAPATREVVATAISKYLGVSKGSTADILTEKFADANTVSEKNALYVADAVNKGIIDGFDDDTIRGNASLTRAQAATVMYRAINEYVELPEAYYMVVAEVGDIEFTLGDVLYTIDFDEGVDLSNPKVLVEQLKKMTNNVANQFKVTEVAKSEEMTLTDEDVRAMLAYRAQYTSMIGYRKYCENLNFYGSTIEYFNSYFEMLTLKEKLLGVYTEEELLKKIDKVDAKIYNDRIEKLTLSDLAVG